MIVGAADTYIMCTWLSWAGHLQVAGIEIVSLRPAMLALRKPLLAICSCDGMPSTIDGRYPPRFDRPTIREA